MSGDSAVSAAFDIKRTPCGGASGNSGGGIFQPGKRAGAGLSVRPGSYLLCDAPAKVYYHGNRNGSFRGTGGITTITVAVIVVTGVVGNVIAEFICRLFRIEEPVAVGLAIGTSSHAIGTSKAMELGEIQGAMSSLSIAVAGLLTVVGASVFANFL